MKMETLTYTRQEATSHNIRDDFHMTDENGKWNFHLVPAMTIDGDPSDFYEIYLGKKFFRSYNSVKDCIDAIKRNFIQDRKGNGLIEQDEFNIIKIEIKEE